MAVAKRVEVRPAKEPTVAHIRGYEYVTTPPHFVRIHVELTEAERELCAPAIDQTEHRRPFKATRCEWDKCLKGLGHTITLVYYIHDNSFGLTNPHHITRAAIDAIHQLVKEQRQKSRKKS